MRRLEIETPISAEAYAYYKSFGPLPMLRKLRAHPAQGVTVDWCEGRPNPIVEIENVDSDEATRFYEAYRHVLVDMSDSAETSSEALAYALTPDALRSTPDTIGTDEILAMIMRERTRGASPVIVGISGRSGSGKSTVTNKVLDLIPPYLRAVRLSTDDYHRGKTWLESTYGAPWTNWDAPEVYDTALLAHDLTKLRAGQAIDARQFSFSLEEPVIEGETQSADFILVEGIYAGSPDLATHRNLNIVIPTPFATSVGRRLERDKKEGRLNASLAGLESILRYQLETAEPMYRQQMGGQV